VKKNITDKHNQSPVIIIAGGGWSGLATAVKLISEGYKVRLIEASPDLGGRARTVTTNNMQLDNGQHILLGAYANTLKLTKLLNLNESDLFSRKSLDLKIQDKHNCFHIKAASLPNPLHMLSALMFAKGISVKEKILISQCWLFMLAKRFKIKQDISVLNYLKQHKQTNNLIKFFWEPLCIGALNTQTNKASIQVFLAVLKYSFTQKSSHSDILLPKKCLDDLLPAPAKEFINNNGGQVSTGVRLLEIQTNNQMIHNIKTSENHLQCEHLVLATPYQQTLKLLSAIPEQSTLVSKLQKLNAEPISTLYLQYPETVAINNDMIGLVDTMTQWLIDRKSCGQPGLIAAVISASGTHSDMDKQTLTKMIISEIKTLFPDWPEPISTKLIREKHATFSCHTEINHLRPISGNIGQNIWLAGDYTDTGLPATIEGAVSSGLECASKLIDTIKLNQGINHASLPG